MSVFQSVSSRCPLWGFACGTEKSSKRDTWVNQPTETRNHAIPRPAAGTHGATTISLAAPAMSFKLTMGMSPF